MAARSGLDDRVGALVVGPADRYPLCVELARPHRNPIDDDVGTRLRDVGQRRQAIGILEHVVLRRNDRSGSSRIDVGDHRELLAPGELEVSVSGGGSRRFGRRLGRRGLGGGWLRLRLDGGFRFGVPRLGRGSGVRSRLGYRIGKRLLGRVRGCSLVLATAGADRAHGE